ncbi:MAG: RdgB/HAM1 family non-canonical purine NTP pyrophosphatase [Acidobacteria bacterium]|nr:RdgB/HAM1 family non-canonical purine NTP pyrophosphatase [Acidobacteriota bacterium]
MNYPKILIATNNKGKRDEISSLLGSDFKVLVLDDLHADFDDYEETGNTFCANAEGKAMYFHNLTGLPTVADDSGLIVPALGGAPGVHSARWAGENADDKKRIAKLLHEMKDLPGDVRKALFVCNAAFADKGGIVTCCEGEVSGEILTSPSGANGFGYDPVFFYPSAACTFAEMNREDKNKISHRGIAFRAMADYLKNYFTV